ncbi:cuticle protein 1-like [Periplaneta americana]
MERLAYKSLAYCCQGDSSSSRSRRNLATTIDMYKLVILAALVAVAAAQADKYPAGLNPAVCPNYPHCDNAVVALYNNLGQVAVPYTAAQNYPAGVSPAACPNYPYCGSYAPLGYHVREYPAGVSAAACPNYPYCY